MCACVRLCVCVCVHLCVCVHVRTHECVCIMYVCRLTCIVFDLICIYYTQLIFFLILKCLCPQLSNPSRSTPPPYNIQKRKSRTIATTEERGLLHVHDYLLAHSLLPLSKCHCTIQCAFRLGLGQFRVAFRSCTLSKSECVCARRCCSL